MERGFSCVLQALGWGDGRGPLWSPPILPLGPLAPSLPHHRTCFAESRFEACLRAGGELPGWPSAPQNRPPLRTSLKLMQSSWPEPLERGLRRWGF